MSSRSFTIETINKYGAGRVNYIGGRFISETPSAAAKKAFTKAYHHLKAKGPMSLKICVRETTADSLKKEYTYRVTKKSEKVEIERDGEIITYNFTTKTKSLAH
jgi:hypothetical protein